MGFIVSNSLWVLALAQFNYRDCGASQFGCICQSSYEATGECPATKVPALAAIIYAALGEHKALFSIILEAFQRCLSLSMQ